MAPNVAAEMKNTRMIEAPVRGLVLLGVLEVGNGANQFAAMPERHIFLHWIVAGLDRGRLHWSDSVPPWLQALAATAVAGGYALCFWAMAVSRFFSSVVRN